ncbi:hypothetical protein [Pantoea agglomerans]|uniref:hypothetical protein n=1 Tax=Enterobacter agglomerans TaxID=549 RepID=UPI003C7E00C6
MKRKFKKSTSMKDTLKVGGQKEKSFWLMFLFNFRILLKEFKFVTVLGFLLCWILYSLHDFLKGNDAFNSIIIGLGVSCIAIGYIFFIHVIGCLLSTLIQKYIYK